MNGCLRADGTEPRFGAAKHRETSFRGAREGPWSPPWMHCQTRMEFVIAVVACAADRSDILVVQLCDEFVVCRGSASTS